MTSWIAVFVGGGFGSVARYGISRLFEAFGLEALPWATLGSNVLSSALLALIAIRIPAAGNAHVYALLAIGFCGGFSTFSTFSFETLNLIRTGNMWLAIANVVLNLSVCFALVYYLSEQ